MKKFFAILLTGVLTPGLAACGGCEPAADETVKPEQAA